MRYVIKERAGRWYVQLVRDDDTVVTEELCPSESAAKEACRILTRALSK